MSSQSSAQEKTEQATPKRLQDSRKKGQIARSRDLNTMLLMFASAGGLIAFGGSILDGLTRQMHLGLSIKREHLFDATAMQELLGVALLDSLVSALPFLGLLFVVALFAPMLLGGWSFSLEALMPKADRLSIAKGFGRIFSKKGIVEPIKAFGKFALVAGVSGALLYQLSGELLGLGNEAVESGLAHAADLISWSFVGMSAALILIAAIDVPFQLWDHAEKLKMTKQEVRDEQKETEGNPELKAKVRAVQRQMAQQRMMDDVPDASVVVTNPTHYAVALRYDQDGTGAPTVVAKGAELVAARIRQVATENNVALVSAPPLARALFFNTEIGQEIPAGLYIAVAQLLAYVYQLNTMQTKGGIKPELPSEFPVPDEYIRH